MHVEALAVQLDGVDADVDEQFHAVVQFQSQGMARVGSGEHRTRGWGDDRRRRRIDGNALTDHTGGEDRIGNLLDR